MDKPISILINEFKQSLISIINSSGLHPTIISMVVSDIYTEIKALEQNQAKQEEQQWAEAQKTDKQEEK